MNGVSKEAKERVLVPRVNSLRRGSSKGTFSGHFLLLRLGSTSHGLDGGCGTVEVGCTNGVSKGERGSLVLQVTFIGHGQALSVLVLSAACGTNLFYRVDGWDACAHVSTSFHGQNAWSRARQIALWWLEVVWRRVWLLFIPLFRPFLFTIPLLSSRTRDARPQSELVEVLWSSITACSKRLCILAFQFLVCRLLDETADGQGKGMASELVRCLNAATSWTSWVLFEGVSDGTGCISLEVEERVISARCCPSFERSILQEYRLWQVMWR